MADGGRGLTPARPQLSWLFRLSAPPPFHGANGVRGKNISLLFFSSSSSILPICFHRLWSNSVTISRTLPTIRHRRERVGRTKTNIGWHYLVKEINKGRKMTPLDPCVGFHFRMKSIYRAPLVRASRSPKHSIIHLSRRRHRWTRLMPRG